MNGDKLTLISESLIFKYEKVDLASRLWTFMYSCIYVVHERRYI